MSRIRRRRRPSPDPADADPWFCPKARIGSTRPTVAMISVTRLATGLRISGSVEKIPSVRYGVSPRSALAAELRVVESQASTAPIIAPTIWPRM